MKISNNILLIENEEVGKTYKALLESSFDSVSVTWVKTRNEAMNAIKTHQYKIVIFDQRLDNGELGINVMRELKKEDDSLVGILLSAYSMPNDTISAINDDILCDYVNKEKIDDIIPAVIKAFQIFQSKLLLSGSSNRKYLGKAFNGLNIFHPYKYYLLSNTIINDKYVFDEHWSELYIINAGEERCIKTSIEVTSNIRFEEEVGHNSDASVELEKIKEFLSGNFSNQITVLRKSSTETITKELEEIVKTYKMPEIPQDVSKNYLTTTIFEGNQIFKEYRVVVMRECGLCRGHTFYSFKVYIPTNGKKLRKINTYKDGTQEIIEVSVRN